MTAATPLPALRTAQALSVYQSTDGAGPTQVSPSVFPPSVSSPDFSALLTQSLEGAIGAGRQADALSMQAISGSGDLTEVVAAVSRAQLALQTTVAIRDRVLQAYQDVIKMPI